MCLLTLSICNWMRCVVYDRCSDFDPVHIIWALVLAGAAVLGAFGFRSSDWIHPKDNPSDVSCGPYIYCVGDDCHRCVVNYCSTSRSCFAPIYVVVNVSQQFPNASCLGSLSVLLAFLCLMYSANAIGSQTHCLEGLSCPFVLDEISECNWLENTLNSRMC